MGLQWNVYYQINTLHAIWRVGSSRKPCCDIWLLLPYNASAVTTGNSIPAVVRLSNRTPNNYFIVSRWGPLIFVLRYPRDQVFPIPAISVYHRSSHCLSHWRAFAIGRCRSREGWVGRGRFVRQQRGGEMRKGKLWNHQILHKGTLVIATLDLGALKNKQTKESVDLTLVWDLRVDWSIQNWTMQRRHSESIVGRHQDDTRPPNQVQYCFCRTFHLLVQVHATVCALHVCVCKRKESHSFTSGKMV